MKAHTENNARNKAEILLPTNEVEGYLLVSSKPWLKYTYPLRPVLVSFPPPLPTICKLFYALKSP